MARGQIVNELLSIDAYTTLRSLTDPEPSLKETVPLSDESGEWRIVDEEWPKEKSAKIWPPSLQRTVTVPPALSVTSQVSARVLRIGSGVCGEVRPSRIHLLTGTCTIDVRSSDTAPLDVDAGDGGCVEPIAFDGRVETCVDKRTLVRPGKTFRAHCAVTMAILRQVATLT